ncbi:MAG: peptidoglycan DD-metalloendopeptidase family protein, partial [Halanaerobiaceae bacterium]|nr:peptidoglycan DD-metalloendopeptidase family protein [Halanaerobiaceae bacterium]
MGRRKGRVFLLALLFLFFVYYIISSSDNNTVDSSGIDFGQTDISNDIDTLNSANISKIAVSGEEAAFQADSITDLGKAEVTGIQADSIADLGKAEVTGIQADNIADLVKAELIEIEIVSSTVIKEAEPEDKPEAAEARRVSLMEQIQVHRVQKGESLWVIARKYNVDIDTLIGANDIANMNRIKIGDELRILPVKGILYKINPGESLWTISRKFKISIDKIVEANALDNPDLVQPGVTLILPGAKPEFGYKDRLGNRFIYPVNARISSYYGERWGRMHEGIDFAVNVGTKVKASRAGKVIYSGWSNGYGYTVIIEHQKGVRTLYAHNSKLLVRSGQWVEQGEVICLSGNTGRSTGPHLHFEIQINGQAVNPF